MKTFKGAASDNGYGLLPQSGAQFTPTQSEPERLSLGYPVELNQLLDRLLMLARLHAFGQTALEVSLNKHALHLLQRFADGKELLEDVDAVLVLLHHALNAFQVALHVLEPPKRFLLVVCNHLR